MNKIFEWLSDLFYPRHCPGCGEILQDPEALLCEECRAAIRPIRDHYCLRCGAPTESEEEYCRDCQKARHSFTAGRSVFVYDDRWKRSLEDFKYFGRREYGRFYGRMMSRVVLEERERFRPDLLVPVPLTPRKQRKRGFNQAALLAREISRCTGIPADYDLVRKIRRTPSQKKLTAAERRKNLRGAFAAARRISNITILIIDDVYTTGSTIDSLAEILLAAGARAVYFVTLCTAPPHAQ